MNKENENIRCKNCRFAARIVDPNDVARDIRECRRFPPNSQLMPMQNGQMTVLKSFPIMDGDQDWCFEFNGHGVTDGDDVLYQTCNTE